MQTQDWWTLVAAAIAVVALVLCALLARRMARLTVQMNEVRRQRSSPPPARTDASGTDRSRTDPPTGTGPSRAEMLVPVVTTLRERADVPDTGTDAAPAEAIMLPTPADVTRATLGRPVVRSAVVGAGVWHALRPESRDRIRGIVRREFRRRRRARLAAGRRAARSADVSAPTGQAWLGSGGSHRTRDEDLR